MKKDFNKWNNKKQTIHDSGEYKLYHAREIWWCSLGVNVGSEQDGTGENAERPVLIVKGLSKQTCIIVPLTSSPEKHKMRVPIGKIDGRQASVIISQIRVVDTKRLINKLGFIEANVFREITKTLRELF
jgi:mRNA-degrading endonuclease toxin of MazEF toxin-antitoxin module